MISMISVINNKRKQLTRNSIDYIIAESNNITHCIADKSYSWIYFTGHDPVKFSRRLNILHKLLNNPYFVRCHKSNLINISYIKEFYANGKNIIVLKNGIIIKVSRRKITEFKSYVKIFTASFYR